MCGVCVCLPICAPAEVDGREPVCDQENGRPGYAGHCAADGERVAAEVHPAGGRTARVLQVDAGADQHIDFDAGKRSDGLLCVFMAGVGASNVDDLLKTACMYAYVVLVYVVIFSEHVSSYIALNRTDG